MSSASICGGFRSCGRDCSCLVVSVQATGSVEDLGGGNAGAGASTPAGGMVASSAAGTAGVLAMLLFWRRCSSRADSRIRGSFGCPQS